ncbi:undecaprenyl-diphosphate phosphatase [Caldimonas caldifontis]|uniref:Undecaprenyl-diphosphatase n=1 Tax=Caldimonas caldifontis TaxID=1452508 RepID=A0A2S5SYA9_9BURK|nr:undecaprenyl-diphosphate phosphatase [Caldimonas caldifontis]PPE67734.1 undecaprenyl-diphosphatase [Caldimonas caldifontis]
MDLVLLWKAALMGVVEGLTEFLPISSTGHLILVGALLDLQGDKAKVFEVVIQVGAILAVLSVYAAKLREVLVGLPRGEERARRFTVNVLLGFAPAAVMGVLLADLIKNVLFNPLVVATGFIVGGLIILWAEHWQRDGRHVRVHEADDVGWRDALKVGLVQCLALIPGTSRSGATIIGGMLLGLSRKAATEFSFFLAIPMIVGAAVYDLARHRALLQMVDLPWFAVGLIVSWLSAWVCVRWLLHFVARHSFVVFGWYRIAFGLVVLGTAWAGWVDWHL